MKAEEATVCMALRAEDLMVGDWVYVTYPPTYPIPAIVEAISPMEGIADGYTFQLRHEPNEVYFVRKGRVKPIPLTEEILEKNFPNPTDELSWFPEEGGFNCHTYVPNCEINAFGLFKYVHELQHALRLCKIDKEIEL